LYENKKRKKAKFLEMRIKKMEEEDNKLLEDGDEDF